MIFRRKRKCPSCGFPVEEEWNYCPNCGFFLGKRMIDVFSPFFESIEEEFRRIDRMVKEFFEFPSFEEIEKIEKKYKPVKFGGISIVIKGGTGKKPVVKIRTYGNYKKFEPELRKKLGVEEYEKEKIKEEKVVKVPKITEEPKTKVEKKDGKIVIEIDLPDVKDEKDIEIKKLEQSIEIKAFAGDKAYFKLLPIPPNMHIAKKDFKNGKLMIILE